ncbi:MAG TPA: hypothetical protein VHQ21_03725 [Rhodanobacteraceae bacterium]|jgi:hypothetical protein|nr:hypothetical protein [Rhodanobacteraceae bacterium]
MSRYHGEQSWHEIRHQALQGWRDLSEDDFEALRAIRREHEVRERHERSRSRRERQTDYPDIEQH